jgi:hypothetical protein
MEEGQSGHYVPPLCCMCVRLAYNATVCLPVARADLAKRISGTFPRFVEVETRQLMVRCRAALASSQARSRRWRDADCHVMLSVAGCLRLLSGTCATQVKHLSNSYVSGTTSSERRRR